MDLREDTQLMEKDPQPIPRIYKVVRPLQAYIRRPSHLKKKGEIEKYLTYKEEDIEDIKLMIS